MNVDEALAIEQDPVVDRPELDSQALTVLAAEVRRLRPIEQRAIDVRDSGDYDASYQIAAAYILEQQ